MMKKILTFALSFMIGLSILQVSAQDCPNAIDLEGNIYPSVHMGNVRKCWTTKNLRSRLYSDGRPIKNLMSYRSYEYPDTAANINIFGYLYDWYAVADTGRYGSVDSVENAYNLGHRIQGICPDGWHLPSDDDYEELNVFPTTDLRSTSYWINGANNTNSTGFSSLPAGRYSCANKRFENLMGNAYYWTCHPVYDMATGAMIDFVCEKIIISSDPRCNGYSVRCVYDIVYPPTVTTAPVIHVSDTSVICGGEVTDDGGANVTARGVCWSTSPNPTIADSHTIDSSGTGSFGSSITGLTAGTTYYVRAYATNSEGTAYGNEVKFNTVVIDSNSCPEAQTVSDHEGNVYATVKIGKQCWTRQNLRTTTSPSTGTYIVTTNDTATYTGKQARWYRNDSAQYAPQNYGLLYNWNAAVDTFTAPQFGETSVNNDRNNAVSVTFTGHRRGICPEGWHLPSNAEWDTLTTYVGSQINYTCGGNSRYIAKALADTTGWQNNNTTTCAVGNNKSDNNKTGFSAVPAGYCSGSSFSGAGVDAYFWSSTQINSYNAWDRVLRYLNASVGRYYGSKYDGFSVRCVRDEATTPTVVIDSLSCPEAKTVTDIEGNTYATVKIGNQCWMRQNLRSTMYADSTAIPAGGDSTSNTIRYYYDYNSSNIPLEQRGYLYNWSAATRSASTRSNNPSNAQGICPDGWHLPSNAEWDTLTTYVGSQSEYTCGGSNAQIAKALADTTGWQNYTGSVPCAVGKDRSENNKTGFSAVPAGVFSVSQFSGAGLHALFWSSTEYSGSTAWNRILNNSTADVGRYNYYNKSNGFSVRCVKDENGSSTAALPAVSTSAVSNIADTSATCGGEVTDDGGANVTARGVCWSTSPNPTIDSAHTNDGTGTGSFSSNITGLTANTTYYVRAYATNSEGTAYGNEVSFTTVVIDSKSCPEAKTVTDHENNTYATVKIGNQCWTRQNLRTTTSPSTGTYLVTTNDTATYTGKQARWYGNDSAQYAPRNYGLLYNWNAAVDTFNNETGFGETSVNNDRNNSVSVTFTGHRRGICPEGWHLPSDAEWDTLTTYVGSQPNYTCDNNSNYIAKALADTTGWNQNQLFDICAPGNPQYPNNATGFSAVPAGIGIGSSFIGAGGSAKFWSSTQRGSYDARGRVLGYNHASVDRDYDLKSAGYSVRCVKDEATTPTVVIDSLSCPEAKTVTDVDNNTYATVKIGNQCWMRQNLRTKHYANGDTIPAGEGKTPSYTDPYYYEYPENETDIDLKDRGLLYNWSAATRDSSSNSFPSGVRGICPTGWHLPSDAEWDTLTTYVSSKNEYTCNSRNTHIAKALADTTGWNQNQSFDICAPGNPQYPNNATGFSAVPAGYRDGLSFIGAGVYAYFWSSSQDVSGNAWGRVLYYSDASVYRSFDYKNFGSSVRCVKDENGSSTAALPAVSTNTVSNIADTSASCGGEVTDDGGANVTARGVCWSTSPNPTIDSAHTNDGTGIGSFTSNITGLTAGTTYYVRAYATNSEGTAYGNEVKFNTVVIDSNSCPEARTVTDHEGNVYATVKIGNQCWTRQNLRTTTSPSTKTYLVTTNDTATFTGKQARWYGNDSARYAPQNYGLLYNWNAAVDTFNNETGFGETSVNNDRNNAVSVTFTGHRRGICPEGWHLPSYAEWDTLTNYVSSKNEYICNNNSEYIAKALADTTGWFQNQVSFDICALGNPQYPNNATGFSAVPAGIGIGSSFIGAGGSAKFWSSTQRGSYDAWGRVLGYNHASVDRDYDLKSAGYSVRCVKDEATTPTVVIDSLSCPEAKTVTDVDNNTYATVKIGNQCWMRQNMRATKYADGRSIAAGGNTPSDTTRYYYDNNSSNIPLEQRSYLYNWVAAMDSANSSNANPSGVQGICPDGWHLPSDAEWNLMEQTVSGSDWQANYADSIGFRGSHAGKLAGGDKWRSMSSGNVPGNMSYADRNKSGFSAFPVGNCYGSLFSGAGVNTSFWSSTQRGSSHAWCRDLGFNNASVRRDYYYKRHGFSVRCVKDNDAVIDSLSCPEAQTVTDIEGNVYATVKIGNQCWTRENMRATKYADGRAIPAGGSNVSNKIQYYYDYLSSKIDLKQRGYLYNWVAAVDTISSNAAPSVQGICPNGWHVPSHAEWDTLTNYVSRQSNYTCDGNSSFIAKALASTTGWSPYQKSCAVGKDTLDNNATGFSAVPAGYFNGAFDSESFFSCFWSSTESATNNYAWASELYNSDAEVFVGINTINDAFSVRCVRDVATTPTVVIDSLSCPEAKTVTDHEGNVYATVKIGKQCWTRQNLRTTKYADGRSIPAGGDNSNYTIRYYYDYTSSNIPLEQRGYLYNWSAAMDSATSSNAVPSCVRGICPTGWHLPSGAEWDTLTTYVGSQINYTCDNNSDNIAKALADTTGWQNDNTTICAVGNTKSDNNKTGFSAVPAGSYRGSSFNGAGVNVHFWSSTQNDRSVAWNRDLYYNNASVVRGYSPKRFGFSVRCVKDNDAVIDEKSCPEAKTVTDVDNNAYATVKIGNQCWMRENLRTTKYANGTAIDAGGTTTSTSTPYYYNYTSSGIDLKDRGLLYNWSAATRDSSSNNVPSGVRGICPTGWHLPSDAEWNLMEQTVSGSDWQANYADSIGRRGSHAGKLAGGDKWSSMSSGNVPGNMSYAERNAFGFSAVPAGYCNGLSFSGAGVYASFWSSTQDGILTAWCRDLIYYYASVVRYNYGKHNGYSVRCVKDENGSSTAALPTVSTSAVSNIADTSASCGGEVTDDGGANVTARGVCWSTSQNPTIDSAHTSDGSGIGSFGSNITGLTASTTYYVRAYATNSEGTAYGNEVSFTTQNGPCPGAPTVIDVDSNVYNTVKIGNQCWMKENLRTTKYADGSTITAGGDNESNTERYYYDYTSSGIDLKDRGLLYNWAAATRNISSNENPSGVQGICPDGWHLPSYAEWNTLINYVRSKSLYICGSYNNQIAKALADSTGWQSNDNNCAVGNTQSTNNLTGFSAVPAGICNGSIYDKAGNYANFWSSTEFTNLYAWYCFLTDDQSNVTMTRRDNFFGKSVRCVKDLPTMPTVSTSAVSNITDTSASCGGEVIANGGSNITARGVCWSTSPNPTVDSAHTSDGSGMGSFSSSITGLTAGTTYYVRAYATNSEGTAYGNEVKFNTVVIDSNSCPEAKTVTDIEGNEYATVQIGNQCWMRQNLRTKHYADSTAIAAGGNNTNNDIPYYYDNTSSGLDSAQRGLLYNWAAVMNNDSSSNAVPSGVQGICPDGWHVPSNAEWNMMERTVSGSDWLSNYETYYGYRGSHAGKLAGGDKWQTSSNANAPGDTNHTDRNASGFSAVPAGYCEGPSFDGVGRVSLLWSSTQYDSFEAWSRNIDYDLTGVGRIAYSKHYGFSVRCVRNEVVVIDTNSCPEAKTVTDYEGNTYATVKIGNQCWMRQNMRATKYADGTAIAAGGNNESLTNPYYYDYNTSGIDLKDRGLLYNWAAANLVCPDGWHLPSDAEWNLMEQTVSGSDWQANYADSIGWRGTHAGKLAGGDKWQTSTNYNAPGNTNYTDRNKFGFSAVPAGFCFGPSFNAAGIYAVFWSSAQYGSDNAWFRELHFEDASVYRDYHYKYDGLSVRCVKDDDGGSTAALPTVSTNAVSNITDTSASCGGEVIADGGYNITARGVCWSTSPNPTVSDNHTIDGSGMGSFSSSITGLTASTTYYARAYATNSESTAYGNEVSFTTQNGPCPGAPTVIDADSNVYNTVKIGNQCWMKENLRTTKYADGSTITAGGNNESSTERYYYDYTTSGFDSVQRGYLYNWAAATRNISSNENPSGVQGICPDGWHLPSHAEWFVLLPYLNAQLHYLCETVNELLAKSLASSTGWNSSNNQCAVGNNQSTNNFTGFSAVPAGYYNGSTLLGAGECADFWSSTQVDNDFDLARYFNLSYDHAEVNRGQRNKNYANSVRCVKD